MLIKLYSTILFQDATNMLHNPYSKDFFIFAPFFVEMKAIKRSYHPYVPILYCSGVLDKEFSREISTSTLHEWKTKDFNTLFGAEQVAKHIPHIDLFNDYITKKSLSKIINATYRIYHIYSKIYSEIKIKRSKIEKHQKQIISTIENIKETIGFDKALKAFHISPQQFYRWKIKVNCKQNEKFLCRKRHPLQLSVKEVRTVKSYLFNPEFIYWPMASIYYKMLRQGNAFMSLTTFYKYAQLLDFKRQKPDCRNKKYTTGIRATKPFEILHADVTIFKPLDNTKVYIYFIVDNFSRNILGWKASLKLSAKTSFENLQEVYAQYNLKNKPDTILMTDDGSENKAEVDTFILSTPLKRIIAQKDVLFSNSIVEAVNKKFKYEFLYTRNIIDLADTLKCLETDVPRYNNRPHASLFGLTPEEVCSGAIPNNDFFRHQKLYAKTIRIIENQQCNECG